MALTRQSACHQTLCRQAEFITPRTTTDPCARASSTGPMDGRCHRHRQRESDSDTQASRVTKRNANIPFAMFRFLQCLKKAMINNDT
ncbi:hypothetical protein pdam_00012245 [Pocillopora damicornis]|uniref:Uncharacterized protein n=1 Tax=Pocillopora damicornis TaxID=46731 RepID=A0A3M6TJ87_POCDA|nr:hypothetical protein pdam_00012245 [Pocillopora damicornis]